MKDSDLKVKHYYLGIYVFLKLDGKRCNLKYRF